MLRIGMIGCGGIANHHAKRLKDIEDARIVHCSDVSGDAAAQMAKEYGADKHDADYRVLLDDKAVDAVFVCLPTFLHRDAVVASAEAGKHIFCEKPIAMTSRHAQEMIDACARADVMFTIGFVRRFDSHWGKVGELVKAGRIGRPAVWRHCSAGGGPTRPWFLDREQGGGPLIDGAVHDYDFLRSMFGDAKRVFGSMKTFKSDSTALDTGTGVIQFQSGDEAMLCWSWGLPTGARGESLIDVLGPDGAISFTAMADQFPKGADPKTHGGITIVGKDNARTVEVYEKKDMFLEQDRHFVDCALNGKPPIPTGEDGKRALEIGLGILQSSDTGEPVALA
ncbi:MAG: Gfo/Idh/MocA family oxidoreductase [Planctomycetes bacterium]|nr:Gfo/Idh/MocA family oxidoreductase [Planctomycetota bacterium]